jgi:hypothetical protein
MEDFFMKNLKLSNETNGKLNQISADLLKRYPVADLKMAVEVVARKCHGCTGYCGTGFKIL